MSPLRRREFLRASAAGVAALAPWATPRSLRSSTKPPVHLVDRWSWAMGQAVRLRLFSEDESRGYEAAQAAFAELRRVEAILSRFDPASELAALQDSAGRGPHRASPDLLAVLTAALASREATGGAFDITVEPLMRVWGFREPRLAPPGGRELAEARRAHAAAVIRIEGDTVRLPAAHTRLDVGGIGVGYAMDRAGAVLLRHGIVNALLEVSGDVLALGAPPGKRGWPVDIAEPEEAADAGASMRVLATFALRDRALATSGQLAQAIQLGSRRIGHVLNPAAGEPVTARRQATVVTRTSVEADTASTALLVSGRPARSVIASWVA